MDSRRGGAVIIVMIAILAIIWVGLSHIDLASQTPTTEQKTSAADTTAHSFSITLQHSAEGNMHTYAGEIELPSACYILAASAVMAYTKPPALMIQLTSTTTETTCPKEISKQPFSVSVSSESLPSVAVTLDGKTGNAVQVEK